MAGVKRKRKVKEEGLSDDSMEPQESLSEIARYNVHFKAMTQC